MNRPRPVVHLQAGFRPESPGTAITHDAEVGDFPAIASKVAARVVAAACAVAAFAAATCVAAEFVLAATTTPAPTPATVQVLDDFEDISPWSAHPADGVLLRLGSDSGVHGAALRMDFRFTGGGYAIARRALALDLPENYEFAFRLRGQCPTNHLEFKLIDASNENVWWFVRRDVSFPEEWRRFTVKKRQISFAWGPIGGGELRHAAALEIVVTAGSGGSGTVWIDDLELRPLPPPPASPPAPRVEASSSRQGHDAIAAIDGEHLTFWAASGEDLRPTLTLDLGFEREFGGLVLDWVEGRHLQDYDVEASPDGTAWEVLYAVRRSNGGRDPLRLAEAEARFVRVRARGDLPETGVALYDITLQPPSWGATPEAFFRELARAAPRGYYPRAVRGESSFWTLVGTGDGAEAEALLDTDGRLETGQAAFSIEPFVFLDDTLRTWNELRFRPSLEEGDLPIPSVQGTCRGLALTVSAFAVPWEDRALREGLGIDPSCDLVLARYRLQNLQTRSRTCDLVLALRPFQVNPPAQFLNTPGGCARIARIESNGGTVQVDGQRTVACLNRPTRIGALAFDQGDLVADYLCKGMLPAGTSVIDPQERASAALSFRRELPPMGMAEVALLVAVPSIAGVAGGQTVPGTEQVRAGQVNCRPSEGVTVDTTMIASLQADCAAYWRSVRKDVSLELPPSAREIVQSLWAQLAWILINRDGPAIQPGSRAYDRSWIRDGALTCTALLRLGHATEVREFLLWFASHQYPDGKVPCCIDARGADPVPEHDSHGELIYLAAEYYRYTGDRATVEEAWPAVARAAAYIDTLRHQRLGPEWRAARKEHFYGLLPPSISHEGYSAKPMHSYWDDFWALCGLREAVFLAEELGHAGEAARLAKARDEFTRDLAASVRASLRVHQIDYIPGCADLGDFDATSTTVALSPTGASEILPGAALERTFEKYWEFFTARRGGKPWEAFTPYEMRTIGAFVRLGWRDRALQALEFFLTHRSPPEWRQWAEVVWSDSTAQHFIGDLPHTWVGSDYVRSVLDLLAYEDDPGGVLVLGAGIPRAWLRSEDGVRVRNLRTVYGPLSYSARERDGKIEVRIDPGLRVPPGGIVIDLGSSQSAPPPTVNGRAAGRDARGRVNVREVPADVTL